MRFAVSSSRLVPSRKALLDDRYRLEPPTKEKITRDDEKRYENALQIRQGPGETKTGDTVHSGPHQLSVLPCLRRERSSVANIGLLIY